MTFSAQIFGTHAFLSETILTEDYPDTALRVFVLSHLRIGYTIEAMDICGGSK